MRGPAARVGHGAIVACSRGAGQGREEGGEASCEPFSSLAVKVLDSGADAGNNHAVYAIQLQVNPCHEKANSA